MLSSVPLNLTAAGVQQLHLSQQTENTKMQEKPSV